MLTGLEELIGNQPAVMWSLLQKELSLRVQRNRLVHTKHIDIAYHFLRDLIKSGTLNLVYTNMHQNLADIFTKGLPRIAHQDFTYEIRLLPDQGGVL